jgi:hypothetical protein
LAAVTGQGKAEPESGTLGTFLEQRATSAPPQIGVRNMWTKRPKVRPGDKKLRCKIIVCARGGSFTCDRPARTYISAKYGLDLGLVTCCINHVRIHEKQGIKMLAVDRRRRTADQKEA